MRNRPFISVAFGVTSKVLRRLLELESQPGGGELTFVIGLSPSVRGGSQLGGRAGQGLPVRP